MTDALSSDWCRILSCRSAEQAVAGTARVLRRSACIAVPGLPGSFGPPQLILVLLRLSTADGLKGSVTILLGATLLALGSGDLVAKLLPLCVPLRHRGRLGGGGFCRLHLQVVADCILDLRGRPTTSM